jgi:flagellar basal body-associated protein FliL
MTTSSNTLRVVPRMGRSLWILLATAAVLVLVLVTAAFLVGRVTVSSSSTPAKTSAGVQAPASNDTEICQHVGHFPLRAC